MLHITLRTFAMAVGIGISPLLIAQVPLQPQWTHTWPYGADQPSIMSFAPAWQGNHVVVDPVTGLIYATVSDENMLYSPRFELLHTFASDGTDLTGPQPIVLGPEPFAELYDHPYNASSVTGLAMHDGEIYAGLTYMMNELNFGLNWGNHFEGGALGGEQWRITNNAAFWQAQSPRPATDGTIVLFNVPASPLVYAHDSAGWFKWRVDLPGPAYDMLIEDGVAYVLAGTTVQRMDPATGNQLPEVPLGDLEARLAIKNDMVYTVHEENFDSVVLRKRTMAGTILWEHTFTLGGDWPIITGLVVDENEGVWATVTVHDASAETMIGGYLLGVDASGSALETHTYGDALHSLATDGSMLYMTGWSDNSGTGTFLISADITLITGVHDADPTSTSNLQAWPLPATDQLNVRVPDVVRSLQLLDAVGREVGRWPVQHNDANTLLDLSPFANGRYLLRTNGTGEVRSTAVVIAR